MPIKKKYNKSNDSIKHDESLNNLNSDNNTSDSIIYDSTLIINNDSIINDSLCVDSNFIQQDSLQVVKDSSVSVLPPYMSGNEPITRINHPGHDSGIMLILTIVFILVSFSFNNYRRMLSIYGQNLWTIRRRANAFDEHTTNERSVIVILLFQLCVYAGILISAKINTFIPINPDKIFLTTCCMMGLYGIYYLFQLLIYSMVGYVFTDEISSTQWLKGFNSSHILLGFALIIPTVISIFYPTTINAMINVAIILYVIARLMFISKGFRIFYNNFYSLFYFILYLCTLEIIPVIFVYGIAQIIISNLQ